MLCNLTGNISRKRGHGNRGSSGNGETTPVLKDIKAIAFDVQGTCVDFYQPLLRVGNKIIEAPAGENVNSSNGSASMSFK